MMSHTTALGVLSVVIGGVAYAIYITQTIRKEGVQPHPFSWFLWFLVTLVAYLVQQGQGGEAGSWVTLFTAVICFVIGVLTLLKNHWHFSWSDWFSLGAGLFVLGFYMFAKNPTYSAIFATIADVAGYWPTLKKGWAKPNKDSATSFALNGAKFAVALPALGSYSIATWLYPATITVVNSGVAVMLLARRHRDLLLRIVRRAFGHI
jgi:hypothetical protein